MNIRFKITLLFTLVVTGILSLISYSVYYFSERGRQESFKIRLKGGATNRAKLYTVFGANLRSVDSSSGAIIAKRFILIYDQKTRQPLYQFYGGDTSDALINDNTIIETIQKGESYFIKGDYAVSGVSYKGAQHSLVAFFGGDDEDGRSRIRDLKRILFFSLLVGVLITFIVGIAFSSQLVRPITRIIREVDEISSHNLSHRIYAGEGQDELSRLANTFNDLLNRLQESFTIQRRFISNASHELSTPLTSISSQLQVTLQKERNTAEYQNVMHSVQEDVEQMQQLTKSLLEIAKTGYEGGIELDEVRIDEVLFKVVSDVKKINPAYNVDLEFGEFPEDEKYCLTYGNANLLYSALKNITENGCKYSPDKHSHLLLRFQNSNIIVEIKNQGDVIAEEEIENIFHPFYRAATSMETKGFGLGLALSKRIIALHKGEIQVKSSIESGTVFIVTLPSLSTYYPQ